MSELRTCPSRDELRRMVLGQLPDATAQGIQEHLEWCSKCMSALEECVASDELLEAVRAGHSSRQPTVTMYLPVELIRGAVQTWIRAHDSTQSNNNKLPVSMADIKRLLDPPQAAEEIGRLADFRVLRVLGVGGMAVVFEAEDSRLKRRVALKLMHPAIAGTPGGLDRFLREAQSAAALKHHHVVTIYQVGTQGQTPFMVLELLHGETLEECLARNGRLSVGEVLRIGREIAAGLAAAHARGLLHRDIKPANIWLEGPETPGRAERRGQLDSEPAMHAAEPYQSAKGRHTAGMVKILDFGCAKAWADESGITYPGLLIGTPAYMAPEQLAGKGADPRADLFSLGCVLYRVASGKQPFGGADLLSVVRALALEEPIPIRDINPEMPQALSDLVGELLSKSPENRPSSARAVVDRLQAIERSLQTGGAAASRPTLDSTAKRRLRRRWAIGAGIGLTLLVSLVCYFFGGQVIRVITNKGQIIIEVDDPDIGVTVSENRVVIHDGNGPLEITLDAGEHQLDVTLKQPWGEARFKTDRFTLQRGGRKVIESRQGLAKAVEPVAPSAPKPPESRMGATTRDQGPETANADLDRTVASWVLSKGGFVTVEAGQPAQRVDVSPGSALPSSAFKLRAADLQRRALTDADLVHFRGLKQLIELRLGANQIIGPGLANLRDLTELRSLILWNTAVTDAALKDLEGLTKLKFLSLDGAHVTDAGLVHLKPLTNLRDLNLNWTRISGAGLAHLDGLSHLEILYLRGRFLTNAGLIHIRGLKSLRTLHLSEQPVSDAGLAHIADLHQLQVLSVDSTNVTDAGLVHLKPLKSLRELNLSWTHVTDAGLERLEEELPQLESLYLRGLYLSDAGLVHLHGFKKLTTLYLSGQPVTNAGLLHIISLERLESLGLSSTHVTDAGLADLWRLKNLQFLNVDGTRVTDAGLAHLKKLPELQILSLGSTRVSGSGLAVLQGVKMLHILILKGATQIGDAAIPKILMLRGLTEINLSGTQVTADGVATLKASLPQCRIITTADAQQIARP